MGINTKSVSSRLILKQLALQITLFVGIVVLLFSFQNCGGPIEVEDSASGASKSVPFAYDTQIDTIVYLSSSLGTSGSPSSPPPLFTYKVGSYRPGSGVRLTDDFLNSTSGDRAAALANSYVNAGVYPQVSVMRVTGYFGALTGLGPLFTSLSAAPTSTALASAAGGRIIPSATGRKFEGVVGMSSFDETLQYQFRAAADGTVPLQPLSSAEEQAYIALGITYRHPKANILGTADGYPYGSFIQIRFNGRVMSEAIEADFLKPDVVKAYYTCPSSLVFKVVRYEDRGPYTTCNTGIVQGPEYQQDATPTAENVNAYNTLRAILPATQWAIDPNNKCIVSKVSGVTGYASTFEPSLVIYSTTPTCVGAACAQFLSVCQKQ